jgi:hypothetical protein
VKPPGWSFGEKLLSGLMNTLDIDHSNSVDSPGGGTHTGAHVFDNITAGSASKYKLSSRNVIRVANHVGAALNAAAWSVNADGTWANLLTSETIVVPIDLPDGASIIEAGVSINPAGGHGGLPGNMPDFELYQLNILGGVYTAIITAVDPSASVPAYEAIHSFTGTDAGFTVDRVNCRYGIVFNSEGAANYVAGGLFVGAWVQAIVTFTDDGAS